MSRKDPDDLFGGAGTIRDAFRRMKKTKEEYEKQQSEKEKRDFHTP